MISITIDPISLCDVTDLEHSPFVMEGSCNSVMKIYFETEANKQEYLGTEIHGRLKSCNLNRIFNEMADNSNTRSIN